MQTRLKYGKWIRDYCGIFSPENSFYVSHINKNCKNYDTSETLREILDTLELCNNISYSIHRFYIKQTLV